MRLFVRDRTERVSNEEVEDRLPMAHPNVTAANQYWQAFQARRKADFAPRWVFLLEEMGGFLVRKMGSLEDGV